MKKNISNDLRKELKRKAYSLKPVIMIGQNGLTDAVMNEIDVALNAHELIKIRSKDLDKSDRKQQCLIIEDKLNANIIQQIGFVAVLYRRSLDVNSITVPPLKSTPKLKLRKIIEDIEIIKRKAEPIIAFL